MTNLVPFEQLCSFIEERGLSSFYQIMPSLPHEFSDEILSILPALESFYFFGRRIEWEQRTSRKTGEKKIMRVAEWAAYDREFEQRKKGTGEKPKNSTGGG